jgi:PspA associated protein B
MESDANSSKHDDSDSIFSLTSASISIEEKLGLQFSGSAALCVKIIDGAIFKNTIKDCTDLLNVSKDEFKFDYKIFTDSYNYLWIIITGEELTTHSDVITNVAAGLSSTGDIIEENGFSEQILSVVFKFIFLDQNQIQNFTETTMSSPEYLEKNASNFIIEEKNNSQNDDIHSYNSTKKDSNNINYSNNKNMYLIYNYKTNNFYPYIPNDNQQRNTTKELQTLSILKSLISVENDFSKWFPIKDIPF